MCGGTPASALTAVVRPGLSPRVRGNPGLCINCGGQAGSIPACAGEPTRRLGLRRPRMVYPRVCGGTQNAMVAACCAWGLSPRVRGNRTAPLPYFAAAGSIPACAGEPSKLSHLPDTSKVYPRVCGGTGVSARPHARPLGLSPRVRGNPAPRVLECAPTGSIPACAGEPLREHPKASATWVYPRVCGGTSCNPRRTSRWRGLSPRVRGEPTQASDLDSILGVYPRVCGGTDGDRRDRNRARGLSPRVRGNPLRRRTARGWRGSIPACAGEPPWRHDDTPTRPVYPRVCGGTW